MNHNRGELCLVPCNSGIDFAQKVLDEINKKRKKEVSLLDTEEVRYANTEIKGILNESIRGKDVFIIQDVENHSDGKSVDDNLRTLYTIIGACKRCDANHITAVIPSFPYARQDKQWGREDITAARVAWELEGDLGANHIITIDLHNPAIQGFFRCAQIENLHGSHVLMPHVLNSIENPKDVIIIPTDLGGAKRANFYARCLESDVGFVYKTRDYKSANTIKDIQIMGDLKDKVVYIIDDMIDTAGSLCKVIKVAKKNGAKEIICIATFGLLNNSAIDKLHECYREKSLNKLILTDAAYIPNKILRRYSWIEIVSVAEYFAEIIHRLNKRKSIGELLY
ncbi:ribose-phosphate diphosphokinase [Candidatus Dojkabacteria bacterium]|uniref:ribose-phosphate diphosphokinase n=1 Tax=Candidatus Dojkabacteria bacterium TaxID=2099670 RepID=A0A847VDY2_9BACT|nr:ribose-phosphate diphosphokinase [Candidatus Dojkabacteria bacterium]